MSVSFITASQAFFAAALDESVIGTWWSYMIPFFQLGCGDSIFLTSINCPNPTNVPFGGISGSLNPKLFGCAPPSPPLPPPPFPPVTPFPPFNPRGPTAPPPRPPSPSPPPPSPSMKSIFVFVSGNLDEQNCTTAEEGLADMLAVYAFDIAYTGLDCAFETNRMVVSATAPGSQNSDRIREFLSANMRELVLFTDVPCGSVITLLDTGTFQSSTHSCSDGNTPNLCCDYDRELLCREREPPSPPEEPNPPPVRRRDRKPPPPLKISPPPKAPPPGQSVEEDIPFCDQLGGR
eukprot:gene20723-27536_t